MFLPTKVLFYKICITGILVEREQCIWWIFVWCASGSRASIIIQHRNIFCDSALVRAECRILHTCIPFDWMPNIPRSCVQYFLPMFLCSSKYYYADIRGSSKQHQQRDSFRTAINREGLVSCSETWRQIYAESHRTGRAMSPRTNSAMCLSSREPPARAPPTRTAPRCATRRRHETATNEHGARFIHTNNLTGHAESEKKLAHCMIMLFVCFFWKYIKR